MSPETTGAAGTDETQFARSLETSTSGPTSTDSALQGTALTRRSYLTGAAGVVLAGVGGLFASTSTVSATDAVGGPVVLMGIDAEDGGIGAHGPISVYVDVVDSVLDAVTNGGEGILVVGESGESTNTATQFWDEIGDQTGEPIGYVGSAADIETVDVDGYAMIGVASSKHEMFQTGAGIPAGIGLTEAENAALTARTSAVADHVNAGGGLLGFSQSNLATEYGYVGDIGDFETQGGLSYSTIDPTIEGEEIGITTDLNVCCWHDAFLEFPDFLDVLAYNPSENVAAIGGVQVVVPTVSIGVDGPAKTDVDATEEYDVTLRNTGDDTPENATIELSLTRAGGIEAGDVTLEYSDEGTWTDLSLTDDGGSLSGTLGDDSGAALPNGFDETTPVRATFGAVDTVTIGVEVVGVDTDTVYASTSHDVEVSEPPTVEQCVDLLAGQDIEAGHVCVIDDGEDLTVTYTTTDGWVLEETHLAIGADLDTFQSEGWVNQPGNPRPGRFPLGGDYDAGTDEVSYTASLEDLEVEPGDDVVIAAHAALVHEDDDGTRTESAWGDGERFVQHGNWATHFGYEIQ